MYAASLGLSFPTHEMRGLASMTSEDHLRFYEDPKMTKRSLYPWGPGEGQEMTGRPERRGQCMSSRGLERATVIRKRWS